jgi:transposase InsO family protein
MGVESVVEMGDAFFATLKTEFFYRRIRPTKKAAKTAVGAWIGERYNRRRRHFSSRQIAPVTFEMQYSHQNADIKNAA